MVPSSLIQNEDAPNVLYIADKRYYLFNILSQININISAIVLKLTSQQSMGHMRKPEKQNTIKGPSLPVA